MSRDWYRDLFDEDYLRGYRLHLSPERTRAEAEAIRRLLKLEPGDRGLDLACGQGRHAALLQEWGVDVVGVDLSPVLLRAARDAGPGALVRGDMRSVPLLEGSCDAAWNVFTAFGYFEDEEEDLAVLQEVARVLRRGGRFLLETINRDRTVGMDWPFPRRTWSRGDEVYTLDEITWDENSSRFCTHRVLLRDDGTRTESDFQVRAYGPQELGALVERAGLEIEGFRPGLDPEGTYDPHRSRRMAMISKRP